MANPLFNALGGGGQNPMMRQFSQFMQQMRGRDPQKMIDDLVASGKIDQKTLNQVQQQANQMSEMMNGMRGMFGF